MNLKGPPGELNEEGGSSTQYCVWWRARAHGAQDLSLPLAPSTEPRTGGSASVLAEMNRTELSSGEGTHNPSLQVHPRCTEALAATGSPT